MKSKLLAVLFVLLLASCKNDTAPKTGDYPESIVGTAKGETYTATGTDVIKEHWEKALNEKGGNKHLVAFEIVKSKTQGDTVKDFFMIVAKCDDGHSTMAALLKKKGNEFYFDKNNPVSIICTGECNGGCLPAANAKNGAVFLMCSSCADCIKTDHSLNFP